MKVRHNRIKTLIILTLVLFSSLSMLMMNFIERSPSTTISLIEGNNEDSIIKNVPNLSDSSSYSDVIVSIHGNSTYKKHVENYFVSTCEGIISSSWNNTFKSITGFTGKIKSNKIDTFKTQYPNWTIETDEIIETQMNYASVQTKAFNESEYLSGFRGDTNASIAVMDTGIEANHSFFSKGYEPENLEGDIVGWKDYVNHQTMPYDDNRHGTFISSIVSGTGVENPNQDKPIEVNLYGDFSHDDLFDDYIIEENYTYKLFSFNISMADSNIFINSSWHSKEDGILNEPGKGSALWFELYNTTQLVNVSRNKNADTYYSFNHNITLSKPGIYDLYIKYRKEAFEIPKFSYNISLEFFPEYLTDNYKYQTGIANKTKLVSYKILNKTGLGRTSDLISALWDVIQNRTKLHIISVCLSIGTMGEDVFMVNEVINEVINNGTLVVIAAGNSGIKTSHPLNKLGRNKNAIVVGATNDRDQITSYSSMGGDIGDDVIKPDLVAPGGSVLPNHRSIISGDATSNKTMGSYGTSISTAIVSAAINLLVEARWDSWDKWNSLNLTKWVKIIKGALLMTASETQQLREDDPYTDTIDERTFSPTSYLETASTGLKDEHEGYGRLNIDGAIEALTEWIEVNKTFSSTLASSNEDPLAKHVCARQVNMTKNVHYIFNFTELPLPILEADFDIFLYSNKTDEYGEPILLMSSRLPIFGDILYYTPYEDITGIVVVKAIEGRGKFTLNISAYHDQKQPTLSIPEINYGFGVKNTTVLGRYERQGNPLEENYTVDWYTFYIEYTDNETFSIPPQDIYLHIVEFNQNYSMTELDTILDYTEGERFSSEEVRFFNPGTYHYRFYATDGPNTIKTPLYQIEIKVPSGSKELGYSHSFYLGLGDWNLTGSGWDLMSQYNEYDDRSYIYPGLAPWRTLYFGLYHDSYSSGNIDYTYQSDDLGDDPPFGICASPVINLTGINEYTKPIARFGLRASLNTGDSILLQRRLNWSTWTTIVDYTNIEREWFVEEINLTQYEGSYLQFRFISDLNDVYDPVQNRGFMFDYFALINHTNSNVPTIGTSVDARAVTPTNGSKFQKFTFSCLIKDADNNYPEYVQLEIGGNKYDMYNVYGDWDTSGSAGIVYTKSIIIGDLSDKSFKFHVSDGKYTTNSSWYNKNQSLISYINPTAIEFDYEVDDYAIGYMFSNNTMDDYYVSGTPVPQEETAWLAGDNSWHTIDLQGYGEVIYGGRGDINFGATNFGYGQNWEAKLMTEPVHLKGDHDLHLEFTHNISLQPEVWPLYIGADPDKCVLSISTDYGDSWSVLKQWVAGDEDVFGDFRLGLNQYAGETVMFMFTIDSNDQTVGFGLGWIIYNIYVGYDVGTDFTAPVIKFIEPVAESTVSSIVRVTANITDNRNIDESRVAVYIEDALVESSLLNISISNSTGVMNITFNWDTTTIDDNFYRIKVVAFDKEGNRAEATLLVSVDNGVIAVAKWSPWIVIILISVVSALVMFFLAERYGKVWYDRLRNLTAEKVRLEEIDMDQAMKQTELISPEEEEARPLTMHCKFCDSWFVGDKFDIMCPVCNSDRVYAAYNCMVCGKWYEKEEPGFDYHCKNKSCQNARLIRREREDVEKILGEEGKEVKPFEIKKGKYDILSL